MRLAFLALLSLSVPALAFDADAWLAKRARLDTDAERMRSVYTNCNANVSAAAEDVVIPIEFFASGTVKSSISAARAQYFLDSGLIWAEGVVVSQFKPDGVTVEACVEAKSCVVDRKAKTGWAEGAAKITVSGTTVQGEGIYFSFPEEFVKILSKVVVESTDLKFEGVKL